MLEVEEQKTKEKILSLKEELKGEKWDLLGGRGDILCTESLRGEVVGDWMQHGST